MDKWAYRRWLRDQRRNPPITFWRKFINTIIMVLHGGEPKD